MLINRLPKLICAFCTFPFFLKKFKKLKNDDEVLIALFPHYGDIVYGMLYANQFKKENNCKIAVLCDEKFKKFVENYKCIDRIITYKHNSMDTHYVAVASLFPKYFSKHNIKTTVPDINLNQKYKTAKNAYQNLIYKVKEDNFEIVKLPEVEIKSIENFDEIKNKVVIFNPFSYSMLSNSNLFENMVKIANEKGYICFTNVVGNQQHIEGTKPLNCSIEELYSMLKNGATFVSIRSGAVDTVLSANSNLFVIYNRNKKMKNWFDLNDLRKDKITQVVCNNKKDLEKIQAQFEQFLDTINKD